MTMNEMITSYKDAISKVNNRIIFLAEKMKSITDESILLSFRERRELLLTEKYELLSVLEDLMKYAS